MIVRVFGRVDGTDVIYNHTQGDTWQVQVPLDRDGEYAVEIIAEDDTGNRTYLARMLYTVTAGTICVHTLPMPEYCFSRQTDPIQIEIQPSRIRFCRVYPVCQEVVP